MSTAGLHHGWAIGGEEVERGNFKRKMEILNEDGKVEVYIEVRGKWKALLN